MIRPLASSAAEDCARIHRLAFAHPWSAAEFERLLSTDMCVADGAFDRKGERLTGLILSRRVAEQGEILTIAVAAASHRRGIGGALLAIHLGRLAACGVTTLFLEVGEDNLAALALYRRFGFRQIATRNGYYRKADGSRATALVLRRDLG